MSTKRRFTAIVRKANGKEGSEDHSPLPYVRLSKRNNRSKTSLMTEADMIATMAIREVAPDRLLAAKRIISAFNAGDIDEIKEIVFDASIEMCDVHFSHVQRSFVGKAALYSLWTALFEAFPNGIFRTSDSVINEKKQVYTSFLFFGTKIFPLLIDGTNLEIGTAPNLGGLSSHSSQDHLPSTSSAPLIHASVAVDRDKPMFTTSELLEADHIPEMVFEGRIVLHLNENCRIRKFDFSWRRKY